MPKIKIIECPRDAMQSIKEFIPTDLKVKYLQSLVDVGFDTIDIGSFVSSAVIPQLSDTAEVVNKINLSNNTKLLVITANERGALKACKFSDITFKTYNNMGHNSSTKEIDDLIFWINKLNNSIRSTQFDNLKKHENHHGFQMGQKGKFFHSILFSGRSKLRKKELKSQ
jgi:hydroxymethylglutaryl-CoA lyase